MNKQNDTHFEVWHCTKTWKLIILVTEQQEIRASNLRNLENTAQNKQQCFLEVISNAFKGWIQNSLYYSLYKLNGKVLEEKCKQMNIRFVNLITNRCVIYLLPFIFICPPHHAMVKDGENFHNYLYMLKRDSFKFLLWI